MVRSAADATSGPFQKRCQSRSASRRCGSGTVFRKWGLTPRRARGSFFFVWRMRCPGAPCALFAACLLAACASAPVEVAAPPAPPAPKPAPRDEATAAAIEPCLPASTAAPTTARATNTAIPLDTLLFFGIKPDMTVVEVWPGAGGWYTEVLAPLLAERGKLYAAMMPPMPDNAYVTASAQELRGQARRAAGSLWPGRSHFARAGQFRHRTAGQRRPGRDVPQRPQLDEPRFCSRRPLRRCIAR